MSLSGKVAIVTGSGRGLGLAYARELARQGAAVVINDVDAGVAAEAVRTIEADGGRAVAVVAPVGSTESARQLVRTAVEAFGRLDILVTNAGILRDKSLLKMTDEDFDLVINVHLHGTFTCVREASRYFKENGVAGRIITIGSPTGQRGNFGQTNYAAAKAGIVGMVRTWALEMKPGRRHRQRRHPGGRHRHDQDRPLLPAGRRSRRARRGHAGLLPPRPGLRHRRRRRRTDCLPRLRRRRRRSPARPSASAATACSSGPTRGRRHRVPRGRLELRGPRGRLPARSSATSCRRVGEDFPPLPDDLKPEPAEAR